MISGPVTLRASLGQSENQSIVVQATRAGYILSRLLNTSPTGLKQRIMWRFLRACCLKASWNVRTGRLLYTGRTRGVPMSCRWGGKGRGSVQRPDSCHGCFEFRPQQRGWEPGLKRDEVNEMNEPLLKMLLMSSTKASLTICASERRKATGLFSTPAIIRTVLMSSRNSWCL